MKKSKIITIVIIALGFAVSSFKINQTLIFWDIQLLDIALVNFWFLVFVYILSKLVSKLN